MRLALHWSPDYGRIPAIASAALRAEELGFDAFGLSDHLVRAVNRELVLSHDPVAVLAAIADRTSRIELATFVTLTPLYHPLHLIRSAITLQTLSQNRFTLGVGAGWYPIDLSTIGLTSPLSRVKHVETFVALFRQIWPGGSLAMRRSNQESNDENRAEFIELASRVRAPSLLVAAGSPKMLAMAGEFADRVLLTVPISKRLMGARPNLPFLSQQIGTSRAAGGPKSAPLGFQLQIRHLVAAEKWSRDPAVQDLWVLPRDEELAMEHLSRLATVGITELALCLEDWNDIEWVLSCAPQ